MSQLRVVLSGSTALVKAGASKSRFTAAGLAASAALALSAQGAHMERFEQAMVERGRRAG